MTASSRATESAAPATATLKVSVTWNKSEILRAGEEVRKVVKPDEGGCGSESVLLQKRLHQRLGGRPDEKHQRDDDLGGNQI